MNGFFAVVWMTATGKKILMGVCWFELKVCNGTSNLSVKHRDALSGPFCCKFDGGMGLIQVIYEIHQSCFTMVPYGEYTCIIKISQPNERSHVGFGQKLVF